MADEATGAAGQKVIVVGGGPCGMMLAWQLASNGLTVRVLEKHADFEREFRGELVQASVLAPLERLGILPRLVAGQLALPDVERRLFVGLTRQVHTPAGRERGSLISQPALLKLLHDEAAKHPGYRIDFGATVSELLQESGRVVGVKARTAAGEERLEADAVFVCAGRNTPLRKDVRVEADAFAVPAHVLWLRLDFSDAPEALPNTVDVHMFGGGVVVVLFPTTRNRLQIAYSAPGDLSELKKDPARLKQRLLPMLNEPVRARVDLKVGTDTELQYLHVGLDRLKKWSAPGLMFLGDAAHTMSPVGGLGLNLALRDSFVAANRVLDAVKSGRAIDHVVFEGIEADRRPEVEAVQSMQVRVHRAVMAPLALEHVLFTLLGGVAKLLESRPRPAAQVVEPRYAAPLPPA